MTGDTGHRKRAALLLALAAFVIALALVAAACGTSAGDAGSERGQNGAEQGAHASEQPAEAVGFDEADPTEEEFEQSEEPAEAVGFDEADPTEEEFEQSADSEVAVLETELAAGETAVSEVRIAYLSCGVGDAYCDATQKGIEESAGNAANATVTVIDGMSDAGAQVARLRAAVDSGAFDALIVTPLDASAVVPAVEAAVAAGLPIACTFIPCGADLLALELQIAGQTLYVGSSPVVNGAALGGAALDACFDRSSCNVAFIGDGLDTPFEAVRLQGFEETTLDFREVTIVATEEGGGTSDGAFAAAAAILDANPELDIIVATSDEMALGAERAIEESGRAGDVLLVGNGASEIGYEAVAAGRWYASAVYLPFTEGSIAGDAVILAATGEDIGWPEYVESLDTSDVGEYLIAEFAEDFTPEWSGAVGGAGVSAGDGTAGADG